MTGYSTGRGDDPVRTRMVTVASLRPEHRIATAATSPLSAWSNDFFFGLTAPAPTTIPYDWLVQPVRFRPDEPINAAQVTRTGVGTFEANATTASAASQLEYGVYAKQAELDTQVSQDPVALATWLVAYYNNPRMRCPQITLDLLERTDTERWTILDREIGDRISISGAPATWPEGATSLLIQGISHTIGVDVRTVVWNTSPVIGSSAGVVGPWFRVDESAIDGTDQIPF